MISKMRKKAEQSVQLMYDSVIRKIDQEEGSNGLIILQALYGKLPPSDLVAARLLTPQGIKNIGDLAKESFKRALSDVDDTPVSAIPEKYISVRIAIQALVSNSQLHIRGENSKSTILGFYDPCMGEKKRLRVTYQFQGRIHQVEVDDKAPLAAPLRGHFVNLAHLV